MGLLPDICHLMFKFEHRDNVDSFARYEMKMKATEERMRALGLLTPMSVLTLDEWEIPRDRVVINR